MSERRTVESSSVMSRSRYGAGMLFLGAGMEAVSCLGAGIEVVSCQGAGREKRGGSCLRADIEQECHVWESRELERHVWEQVESRSFMFWNR
jgi:hypothetical protein